jgi:hypothetical protein
LDSDTTILSSCYSPFSSSSPQLAFKYPLTCNHKQALKQPLTQTGLTSMASSPNPIQLAPCLTIITKLQISNHKSISSNHRPSTQPVANKPQILTTITNLPKTQTKTRGIHLPSLLTSQSQTPQNQPTPRQ